MVLPEHEQDAPKAADQVDDHVKKNYAELHEQGRDWNVMADEAERLNDRALAAHLREQAAGGDRDSAPKAPESTTQRGQQTRGSK
jgi:cytochrome c553